MIARTLLLAATLAAAPLAATTAMADEGLTPSKPGTKVYIISPEDGATVSSPVTVLFGTSGMGIAPAGVDVEGTGHHHLLVNRDLPDLTSAVPASEQSIHYGGGQTESVLELEPGTYSLQLLFADHRHIPHDPPIYSERITITVE
ncbi:MAG: DUF4399 domain-containing protein [Pseudomonadota bacterium]